MAKIKSLNPFIYEEAETLILGTLTPKEGRDTKYKDGRYDFFYTSYKNEKLKNDLYTILGDVLHSNRNWFSGEALSLRVDNSVIVKEKKIKELKEKLKNDKLAFFDIVDNCEQNGASDNSLTNIKLISYDMFKKKIDKMPNLKNIIVDSRTVEYYLYIIIVLKETQILDKFTKNPHLGKRKSKELNEALNKLNSNLSYKYGISPSRAACRYNLDTKIEMWKLLFNQK